MMERSELEHLLTQLGTDDLHTLDALLHARLATLEIPVLPPLPASVPAQAPAKPAPLAKYPAPLGDALIGATYRVLVPTKRDKRHLTRGNGLTLCNRDIARGVKAAQKYEANDCQTCLQQARKKRWTCKTCGQPLLRVADKRICAACVKAKAQAKKVQRATRATPRTAEASFSRAPFYNPDRMITPLPGQDVGVLLDQALARDRVGWALDMLLFHTPSPVPDGIVVGREWLVQRVRYTFCSPILGFLGQLLFPLPGSSQAVIEVQAAGHPDDPATVERLEHFTPIASALEERLQQHGQTRLDTSPGAILGIMAANVIVNQPAYRDPEQVAYRLLPCETCGKPAGQQIYAEHGTLADTARMMFEPIRKTNVPTWIIDVSQRIRADDDQFMEVIQAWPERRTLALMTFATADALLDDVCRQHCNANT